MNRVSAHDRDDHRQTHQHQQGGKRAIEVVVGQAVRECGAVAGCAGAAESEQGGGGQVDIADRSGGKDGVAVACGNHITDG